MNDMASRFIDDELSLDSKRDFVVRIHDDGEFYRETLDFLELETMLRGDVVASVPDAGYARRPSIVDYLRPLMRPLAYGLAGAFSVVMVLWMTVFTQAPVQQHMNRFVIYRPDVTRVEITGSFTGWERIPLTALGESGYWEITLDVPKGVHRFTYILEGETPFADPTVLAVENDDFGGINSILTTES